MDLSSRQMTVGSSTTLSWFKPGFSDLRISCTRVSACPGVFIGGGRGCKTEEPKIEADRRPRAGWGSWGEGSKLPYSHHLGGMGCMGSAVSSPSGVRDGSPTAQRFPLCSALVMASRDTILLLIVDY